MARWHVGTFTASVHLSCGRSKDLWSYPCHHSLSLSDGRSLLVNPRATLLDGHRVIKLSIKRQLVQLHQLAVDFLHAVHHILNELRIRSSSWMHTHNDLWLLGLLLAGFS